MDPEQDIKEATVYKAQIMSIFEEKEILSSIFTKPEKIINVIIELTVKNVLDHRSMGDLNIKELVYNIANKFYSKFVSMLDAGDAQVRRIIDEEMYVDEMGSSVRTKLLETVRVAEHKMKKAKVDPNSSPKIFATVIAQLALALGTEKRRLVDNLFRFILGVLERIGSSTDRQLTNLRRKIKYSEYGTCPTTVGSLSQRSTSPLTRPRETYPSHKTRMGAPDEDFKPEMRSSGALKRPNGSSVSEDRTPVSVPEKKRRVEESNIKREDSVEDVEPAAQGAKFKTPKIENVEEDSDWPIEIPAPAPVVIVIDGTPEPPSPVPSSPIQMVSCGSQATVSIEEKEVQAILLEPSPPRPETVEVNTQTDAPQMEDAGCQMETVKGPSPVVEVVGVAPVPSVVRCPHCCHHFDVRDSLPEGAPGPVEVPVQDPAQTPSQVEVEVPAQTPAQLPVQDPVQAPAHARAQAETLVSQKRGRGRPKKTPGGPVEVQVEAAPIVQVQAQEAEATSALLSPNRSRGRPRNTSVPAPVERSPEREEAALFSPKRGRGRPPKTPSSGQARIQSPDFRSPVRREPAPEAVTPKRRGRPPMTPSSQPDAATARNRTPVAAAGARRCRSQDFGSLNPVRGGPASEAQGATPKRGRGRPPKAQTPGPSGAGPSTSSTAVDVAKRGRGRPKSQILDVSQRLPLPELAATAPDPSSEVRRGRGRPRSSIGSSVARD